VALHTHDDGSMPEGVRSLPGDEFPGRPRPSASDQAMQACWRVVGAMLFRASPPVLNGWRIWLLRVFGAHMGRDCQVAPTARIWAPWNLICEDFVTIDEEVEIYNPGPAWLGARCCVSRGALLCGATLDYATADLRRLTAPIAIGRHAWIGARANVLMGVSVGNGAVLGLGAVATRDLEPWVVYAGAPARPIRPRPRVDRADDERPDATGSDP
jgi:putative colanic acid biosynthesis acetyltransferase WcaF